MDTLHISIPSCDTKREGVHSQFLMNFLTISNPNQLRVSDAARLLFNLTLREKKSYFHPISSIPTYKNHEPLLSSPEHFWSTVICHDK